MNISRLDVVRAIPADDLADFSEAIADAAHYTTNIILGKLVAIAVKNYFKKCGSC
jgi:hypothetical protein